MQVSGGSLCGMHEALRPIINTVQKGRREREKKSSHLPIQPSLSLGTKTPKLYPIQNIQGLNRGRFGENLNYTSIILKNI